MPNNLTSTLLLHTQWIPWYGKSLPWIFSGFFAILVVTVSYSLRIWVTFCWLTRKTTPTMPIFASERWRRGGRRSDPAPVFFWEPSIRYLESTRSAFPSSSLPARMYRHARTSFRSCRANWPGLSKVRSLPEATNWDSFLLLTVTGTARRERCH